MTHAEEAAGGGSRDDGVPGVLFLADVDHGAVEGGEEAAPDGEAAADAGGVHADGLGAAGEALAVGGVVEALDKVEGGPADGAHAEGAADVVQDAVRARLARCLGGSHGGRWTRTGSPSSLYVSTRFNSLTDLKLLKSFRFSFFLNRKPAWKGKARLPFPLAI